MIHAYLYLDDEKATSEAFEVASRLQVKFRPLTFEDYGGNSLADAAGFRSAMVPFHHWLLAQGMNAIIAGCPASSAIIVQFRSEADREVFIEAHPNFKKDDEEFDVLDNSVSPYYIYP